MFVNAELAGVEDRRFALHGAGRKEAANAAHAVSLLGEGMAVRVEDQWAARRTDSVLGTEADVRLPDQKVAIVVRFCSAQSSAESREGHRCTVKGQCSVRRLGIGRGSLHLDGLSRLGTLAVDLDLDGCRGGTHFGFITVRTEAQPRDPAFAAALDSEAADAAHLLALEARRQHRSDFSRLLVRRRRPQSVQVLADGSPEVSLRAAPLHHLAGAGRGQRDSVVGARRDRTIQLDIKEGLQTGCEADPLAHGISIQPDATSGAVCRGHPGS